MTHIENSDDEMALALSGTKMRTTIPVLIALGSNLGDSEQILRKAIVRLSTLSEAPLKQSSFWRTEPIGCPSDSPPFLNAVVMLFLRPEATPEGLLDTLNSLEREFGRVLAQQINEPRLLDLDIIAFGNCVISTPRLTIPHPRAPQRAFVLAPLAELVPDLILPGQTLNVRELLKQTGRAGVQIEFPHAKNAMSLEPGR
jgi:2-amino-4-hydroxy-6-hydroxymethyldihydropteridine diphosphokinase